MISDNSINSRGIKVGQFGYTVRLDIKCTVPIDTFIGCDGECKRYMYMQIRFERNALKPKELEDYHTTITAISNKIIKKWETLRRKTRLFQ